MERTKSGLYVARGGFNILKMRTSTKTITLPNGERAKVTIDDSGTVRHVEHGEQLDATVRPAKISLVVRSKSAGSAVSGSASPSTIRAKAQPRR